MKKKRKAPPVFVERPFASILPPMSGKELDDLRLELGLHPIELALVLHENKRTIYRHFKKKRIEVKLQLAVMYLKRMKDDGELLMRTWE